MRISLHRYVKEYIGDGRRAVRLAEYCPRIEISNRTVYNESAGCNQRTDVDPTGFLSQRSEHAFWLELF